MMLFKGVRGSWLKLNAFNFSGKNQTKTILLVLFFINIITHHNNYLQYILYIYILICVYMCGLSGYNMLLSENPSNHQGGVALFFVTLPIVK